MTGIPGNKYEYLSAPENLIKSEPFINALTQPTIKGVIEFQVSNDLFIEVEQVQGTIISIVAAIGGEFFVLYALSYFFFSRYVPWMMQVEVVRTLFMVDPSKGKKPRAAERMAEKTGHEIY